VPAEYAPMFSYTVLDTSSDTGARRGILETPHGPVETPVFMPVGTQGTVKAMSPDRLKELGAEIVLSNTYHLYLRPGHDVVRGLGGLHSFMGWDKPILTDSGGFQVFSLGELRTITEEGVRFQSHLDGSRHLLTPESAVEIQNALGADIIMCLDECTAYPATRGETQSSMEMTLRWAERCREAHTVDTQALFGIVQGGMYEDLRRLSARKTVELDFPGYAVGGLSVGEAKGLMYDMAEIALEELPREKPRYIMGVGTPEDLVNLSALGADMFDCVMPTRNARNGTLFTSRGKLVIKNERFKTDERPVDEDCGCYTCRTFSRAYLRHLFHSGEILASIANTVHNLAFYLRVISDIRQAIRTDTMKQFQKDFLEKITGENT